MTLVKENASANVKRQLKTRVIGSSEGVSRSVTSTACDLLGERGRGQPLLKRTASHTGACHLEGCGEGPRVPGAGVLKVSYSWRVVKKPVQGTMQDPHIPVICQLQPDQQVTECHLRPV